MKKTLEVSFDYKNRDFQFPPLSRSIRGRFLLSRVAEPSAMSFKGQIPEEIPAQVLGIDFDKGSGFLIEPIHDSENLKSRLGKKDFRFEDARQDFPNIEVLAWLYWLRRAVDDGKARVIKGELPTLDEIEYDPPNRLAPQPKKGPSRLREIFTRDPAVAAEYLTWNEDRRRSWEQLVGV